MIAGVDYRKRLQPGSRVERLVETRVIERVLDRQRERDEAFIDRLANEIAGRIKF